MAPKAAQQAAQKKAAKQKKILMVLALPAAGSLVYAYTTFSSLGSKPSVSATPAAATTPASAIPSPTTGSASTPTITPGVAATPVDSLRTFTALGRKDPFNDQGPHTTSPSSSGKGNGKGSGGNSGGSNPKPPSPPPTAAIISLNGKKLGLGIGNEFGHAPGLSGVALFRLVSLTRKTAVIGVVGTQQRFTLYVHRPLTLEQVGGWMYTLLLEPLGSAAPMTVTTTTTSN